MTEKDQNSGGVAKQRAGRLAHLKDKKSLGRQRLRVGLAISDG